MAGRKYNLAIVGATGLVGVELIEALARRRFPVASMRLFASINSAGETIELNGEDIDVEAISADFYQGRDLVFFAAHPMVSRDLAADAAKAGVIVVDAASTFRLDPNAILVAADLNAGELRRLEQGARIVASPSPAAIAIALALAPIHRRFGVRALSAVLAYGTTAGGRRGVEEHQGQTIALFNQSEISISRFVRQSAFNIFPKVGEFLEGGDAEVERELIDELPRLLGASPPISATAMLAPVFCGLASSLSMELGKEASVEEIREALAETKGIEVMDDPGADEFPDTLLAMAKEDVLVGRIRKDPSRPHGVSLWLSSDNLRKGAADNLVTIAEQAVKYLD